MTMLPVPASLFRVEHRFMDLDGAQTQLFGGFKKK